MGFPRYGLALIAGLAVNMIASLLLESLGWMPVLPAGVIAGVAGLVACLAINEAGMSRQDTGFNRRRLRPTLIIAAVLQAVLLIYTLSRFPNIQPLAAVIISGLAGILFAVVGYWRFLQRAG